MKNLFLKTFASIIAIIGISQSIGVFASSAALDTSFNTGIPIGFNQATNVIQKQSDGKILVGGEFLGYKGVVANRIIRLNQDGTKDSSFDIGDGFDESIFDIAIQDDGKIIVVGGFTMYNGTTANRIIRLNANGSIDNTFTIGAGFDTTYVMKIKIQNDGKIIVGGMFTMYNGVAAKKIVRLNTDGTRDDTFTIGAGFNADVYSLALQGDGKILVGGQFTTYNGATVNKIVRLTTTGVKDNTFVMGAGFPTGPETVIQDIVLQSDGKVIVGGSFTGYKGVASNNIIRLSTTGTKDTSFIIGGGFSSKVMSIAIQDNGKILVGGDFNTYNASSANNIIRLNSDGSKDNTFNSGDGFDLPVNDISIQNNGEIFMCGVFTNYNKTPANRIIRLNSDGSRNINFDIGNAFNSHIKDIAFQSDGKIIVGGGFTSYNGVVASNIIRLNTNGSIDDTFNVGAGFNYDPDVTFVYKTTIQSDEKILVGGYFSSYNGVAVNNIVRLNSDGSIDDTFNSGDGFDSSSTIDEIKIQSDGKILVGGNFTSYNGVAVNNIVRLNSGGSIDDIFNSGDGFDDGIRSIAVQNDGKIIVGGYFTSYNGVAANNIIRLNTDGSRDTNFVVEDGGDGIAITIQNDGKIIVGGIFNDHNGVNNAYRIIRLNIDGSRDTNFNNGDGYETIGGNIAEDIAIIDGKIIVGGGMFILSLNMDGTKDSSFDFGDGFTAQGAEGFLYKIAIDNNGRIFLGGDFSNYNGVAAGPIIALYGNAPVVDLPNSNNPSIINNAFTIQGYTENTDGSFLGTTPISLTTTDGSIPSKLTIENINITVSLDADTQLKKADGITNYNGILSVPMTKSIASVNDQLVISAFNIGNRSESIKLSSGVATLLVPVSGQTIGDGVQVFYSNDNGVSWYLQTKTVVIDNNGQPYISFITDHFADFAVTTLSQNQFNGSFSINNKSSFTNSTSVNLAIDINSNPTQMRFSNDGITRSDWEAYSTDKTWNMIDKDGNNSVYAQFDTNSDNVFDIEANDSITYQTPDTTAPIGTISYSTTGTTANDVVATLNLNETGTITNNSGNTSYTFTSNGSFTFEFSDTAGNTGSATATVTWINKTTSNGGGSNGGGGSSRSSPITNIINKVVEVITGPEEKVGSIKNSRYPTETNNAYLWAYKMGITTLPTIQQANIDGKLYRSHLAKMISEYAVKQLKKTANTGAKCEFTDMGAQSTEMKVYAQAACQLGLMGLKSDGTPDTKFNPSAEVTRAQFGTTLSRLLYGASNNEKVGGQRYTSHLNALKKAGIMTKIDKPTMDELRGNVFLMLMRTVK